MSGSENLLDKVESRIAPVKLRSLKLLYFDCGTRDEWNLHLGARLLVERLNQSRVTHEYQEFDDGHMGVSYRYDVSLPKLGAALAPGR